MLLLNRSHNVHSQNVTVKRKCFLFHVQLHLLQRDVRDQNCFDTKDDGSLKRRLKDQAASRHLSAALRIETDPQPKPCLDTAFLVCLLIECQKSGLITNHLNGLLMP